MVFRLPSHHRGRLAPVLKTIFHQCAIILPYHILVVSLTLKQFFINVPYHILVASFTLMALF